MTTPKNRPSSVDRRRFLEHTWSAVKGSLALAMLPPVEAWSGPRLGLAPEWSSPSPEFTARRAAAYQAYFENMPLRSSAWQRPGAELRSRHLAQRERDLVL